MAITLNDITRLRGNGSFARLESLIGKRAAAEKAAETANADLAKATAELKSLGIVVDNAGGSGGGMGGTGGRGKYGKRRGRPPGSKNKAKAVAATGGEGGGASSVGGGRAGKKGAKRGPKAGSERRSSEDYAKALDEIGAEFMKAGKDDIKGPDLVGAMKQRGFASKQVVMNQVRDHKGWKRKGEKRAARYFYKG